MNIHAAGRRRFAALWVAAVAAALAIAGCSASESDSTSSASEATSAETATSDATEATEAEEVPEKPDSLTINVFSGAFGDNMQKFVVEPFQEEYGITVNLVTSAPPLATLQAQGDSPEVDLFIAGDPQRMLAEQAGLLQPYDPAVVTNAADLFDVARKSDSALVLNFASQGLVYDTTKVATAPTSWFDLFDLDLPQQVVVRAPDAQNTVSWLSLMAYTLNGEWPSAIEDYDEVLQRVQNELKPNLYLAASSSGISPPR